MMACCEENQLGKNNVKHILVALPLSFLAVESKTC